MENEFTLLIHPVMKETEAKYNNKANIIVSTCTN